jgi:hypothetical protein
MGVGNYHDFQTILNNSRSSDSHMCGTRPPRAFLYVLLATERSKRLHLLSLIFLFQFNFPLHRHSSCFLLSRNQLPRILLISEEKVRSSSIAYCNNESFFSGVSLMLIISDLFFFFCGLSTVSPRFIKRCILISSFSVYFTFSCIH